MVNIEKSLNAPRQEKKSKKEIISRRRKALVAAIAMSAIIVTGGIIKGFDTFKNSEYVDKLNFQYQISSQVDDEYLKPYQFRVDSDMYAYNHSFIATKLLEDPRNLDQNIYGIYATIDEENLSKTEKQNNMDQIIFNITISDPSFQHKSFEEYIQKMGYADVKEYDEQYLNMLYQQAKDTKGATK